LVAWTDYGYDLLPSAPTVTETPTGWGGSVMGGPYSYFGYTYQDGYSIEFSSATPLAPGGTLTFQFSSPDSPAVPRREFSVVWHSGRHIIRVWRRRVF